jgi:hypothetical protein
MKKKVRFAKKRYHQKRAFSIFWNPERERSVATCPIALMKYMRILSVQGAIHHFLNVGRKAMRSIISVRITVLSIFPDENQ